MIALDNNYEYKMKYITKANNFSNFAITLKCAISIAIKEGFIYKEVNRNTLGFKINEVTLFHKDYLVYKNLIEILNNQSFEEKIFQSKIVPEYIYFGLDLFYEKEQSGKSVRKLV